MSGQEFASDTGPFSMVPEWLLYSDVSDRAIRLYAVLGRFADENGSAYPGRKLLADLLALRKRQSVDRPIRELEEIGAVKVERKSSEKVKATNVYRLVRVPPKGLVPSSGLGSPPPGTTPSPQPRTTLVPGDGHKREPYNENQGNEKEAGASSDPVRAVFDHWVAVRKWRSPKLTDDRKRKIRARLREGYTVAELCKAIDGVANDPWQERVNNDDLKIICRSGTDVEKFVALAGASPNGAGSFAPPCPTCSGSGRVDGAECWDCRGCGLEVVG